MIQTPHSRSMGLAPFTLALTLTLLVGCSNTSPVAGAPEPGPGMVQFTSSDGFLTINVPREWRESTTEASEVYSTLMGDSVSGLEVPAAWDLDGGAFLRGASVVVITHSASPLEADQEVAAEQAWAAF